MCREKLLGTWTSHFELQDQVPRYLRCQKRKKVSLSLSVARRSAAKFRKKKQKKQVSNTKHFQMLKLKFYLTMTMLMLSLLLLLFVCLLHNEAPPFFDSSPCERGGQVSLHLLMNVACGHNSASRKVTDWEHCCFLVQVYILNLLRAFLIILSGL